jgi:hypothetical protein
MQKLIVYFDDVSYVKQRVIPATPDAAVRPDSPTHWVLVACPPRISRYVGRRVSAQARLLWRKSWADKALADVKSVVARQGDQVTCLMPSGSLENFSADLFEEFGAACAIDARRPKFGQDLMPLTRNQSTATDSRWALPGTIAGLFTTVVLALE